MATRGTDILTPSRPVPGPAPARSVLPAGNRIPALDGLRTISILFVLLAHLSGTRHFLRSQVLEIYGNFGVRIFFILSGFLITTLLLDEHRKTGTVSLHYSYHRRAYRILPAAYAFMLLTIAVNWSSLSLPHIAVALTYVSNYYPGGNWVLGHLWSISVQEQFYWLWPLILSRFFRQRLWIVAGLIILGPPARILLWLLWGYRAIAHPFPAVMDALGTGCALAMLQPQMQCMGRWLRSRWFCIIPALTTLLPMLRLHHNRFYQVVGLTVLHLGIAISIQHAIEMRYCCLQWRGVVWLGNLSYSLYLWQQPFLNRNSAGWWAAFPLNLCLALLCAVTSYYCVERPFMAMRERKKRPKVVLNSGMPQNLTVGANRSSAA